MSEGYRQVVCALDDTASNIYPLTAVSFSSNNFATSNSFIGSGLLTMPAQVVSGQYYDGVKVTERNTPQLNYAPAMFVSTNNGDDIAVPAASGNVKLFDFVSPGRSGFQYHFLVSGLAAGQSFTAVLYAQYMKSNGTSIYDTVVSRTITANGIYHLTCSPRMLAGTGIAVQCAPDRGYVGVDATLAPAGFTIGYHNQLWFD